jgi:hypothetical protein
MSQQQWRVSNVAEVLIAAPNCEIEYLLASGATPEAGAQTTLTVREYVDGPVPPALANASRAGWALITQNLKVYLAAARQAALCQDRNPDSTP